MNILSEIAKAIQSDSSVSNSDYMPVERDNSWFIAWADACEQIPYREEFTADMYWIVDAIKYQHEQSTDGFVYDIWPDFRSDNVLNIFKAALDYFNILYAKYPELIADLQKSELISLQDGKVLGLKILINGCRFMYESYTTESEWLDFLHANSITLSRALVDRNPDFEKEWDAAFLSENVDGEGMLISSKLPVVFYMLREGFISRVATAVLIEKGYTPHQEDSTPSAIVNFFKKYGQYPCCVISPYGYYYVDENGISFHEEVQYTT